MNRNVHQTSYELLRDTLRAGLAAAAGSRREGGIGSTPCRTIAALYALLSDHQVDRHGHCRRCRGLRALLRRRRRICRVLVAARFYLYQPEDMLLRLFASELHQHARHHSLRKQSPSRTERRVRCWAIPTPPTCSQGSFDEPSAIRSASSHRERSAAPSRPGGSRQAGSASAWLPPRPVPGRRPMSGAEYPATPLLRRLTAVNGWHHDLARDVHGEPVTVVAVRIGPTWTDSVAIAGENQTVGGPA